MQEIRKRIGLIIELLNNKQLNGQSEKTGKMKKKVLSMVVTLFTTCLFVACSNSDEPKIEESPYTVEQEAVLNIFKGTFKSDKNIAGHFTTIVFLETFSKPKEFVGRNILGDKRKIMIHGILKDFYSPDTDSKYREAFVIHPNGIDMKRYFLHEDNTISTDSNADEYKITIVSNNEFKLKNMMFIYNTDTYRK